MIPTIEGLTSKQMCEHIVKANFLKKPNGEKPTAREIFEYSPTGELFHLVEWYRIAVEILGHHAM